MNSDPLVSIGIPVRNEARFLGRALDSLVNQRYTNIEIIISDNASSDETASIARKFSAEHATVQYHHTGTGIGPADNFNRTVGLASGRYFMWAAGHDLWSENYVDACVQALEDRPEASIAYGLPAVIDETDRESTKRYGCYDTRGMDPISRFFTTFWGSMNPVYGVHRRENLLNHPLPSFVGGDLVLLSHLALKGEFILLTNTQWNRREFRRESSYAEKLSRYKSPEYGLATSWIDRILPLARLPVGLIRAVGSSDLRAIEKVATVYALLSAIPARYKAGTRK